MTNNKKILFKELGEKNGLIISSEQLEQLEHYVALLLDWNKKINVISRKDEENVWLRHILHSVSILIKIEIPSNASIVDIGTGGGLPGIPLKILRPDFSMLCVDSTRKKIDAVANMIDELKLQNANAIWGRAEEIGVMEKYFGKFDFIVARAVAPLNDLVAWGKPFLKKQNSSKQNNDVSVDDKIKPSAPAMFVLKGGDLTEEINIAKRKHANINVRIINIIIEESEGVLDSEKKLVVVEKLSVVGC